MTSTVLILSMISRSSVDRALARSLGGHGFDSCRGLIFLFFVPRSCPVDQSPFAFHYRAQNSPSLFTYQTYIVPKHSFLSMIFKGARSRYFRNFFFLSLSANSKLQIHRVFHWQNQCHKKSRMFSDRKMTLSYKLS